MNNHLFVMLSPSSSILFYGLFQMHSICMNISLFQYKTSSKSTMYASGTNPSGLYDFSGFIIDLSDAIKLGLRIENEYVVTDKQALVFYSIAFHQHAVGQ